MKLAVIEDAIPRNLELRYFPWYLVYTYQAAGCHLPERRNFHYHHHETLRVWKKKCPSYSFRVTVFRLHSRLIIFTAIYSDQNVGYHLTICTKQIPLTILEIIYLVFLE